MAMGVDRKKSGEGQDFRTKMHLANATFSKVGNIKKEIG